MGFHAPYLVQLGVDFRQKVETSTNRHSHCVVGEPGAVRRFLDNLQVAPDDLRPRRVGVDDENVAPAGENSLDRQFIRTCSDDLKGQTKDILNNLVNFLKIQRRQESLSARSLPST